MQSIVISLRYHLLLSIVKTGNLGLDPNNRFFQREDQSVRTVIIFHSDFCFYFRWLLTLFLWVLLLRLLLGCILLFFRALRAHNRPYTVGLIVRAFRLVARLWRKTGDDVVASPTLWIYFGFCHCSSLFFFSILSRLDRQKMLFFHSLRFGLRDT